MKKVVLVFMFAWLVFPSCQKDRRRGDACISADKTTIAQNEEVAISNCGDALPSERVATSLDWGDGIETDGQTGTHIYDTTGTYTIRLMLNGDYAADVAEVDESKVKITITVN